MATTKTYDDFSQLLGVTPHRMGVLASLYPEYNTSFLTDSLSEAIGLDSKSKNKFQAINSMMYEWNVDVKFIKKLAFKTPCIGTGEGGQQIKGYFSERYYEKYDVFQIMANKQQFMVIMPPERRMDNTWEYVFELIDASQTQSLTATFGAAGMETRFLYNTQPEYHDQGYLKQQSNIEKHRNFLSEIRHDVNQSSRYAVFEDAFVKVKIDGYEERDFKFPGYSESLVKAFMETRNTKLLLSKSTMDENGKCTLFDPIGHRELIQGDGIIPQIERFAGVYGYIRPNISMLNKGVAILAQKSEKSSGNTYYFTVNNILYQDLQNILANFANGWKQLEHVKIKRADGKIVVGDEFAGYSFMGNEIIFVLDKALTLEYPDSGYGIMLDLTPNKKKATPAIQQFTLKGPHGNADMVYGELDGLGGQDGTTSGKMSTLIGASTKAICGYSGNAVTTPHRSYIFRQDRTA